MTSLGIFLAIVAFVLLYTGFTEASGDVRKVLTRTGAQARTPAPPQPGTVRLPSQR